MDRCVSRTILFQDQLRAAHLTKYYVPDKWFNHVYDIQVSSLSHKKQCRLQYTKKIVVSNPYLTQSPYYNG